MTTWETLLHGLTAAVRRHGVPHKESMARVLDEEVQSAADLEKIIDTLPPTIGGRPPSANRRPGPDVPKRHPRLVPQPLGQSTRSDLLFPLPDSVGRDRTFVAPA